MTNDRDSWLEWRRQGVGGRGRRVCSVEGCEEWSRRNGLCVRHSSRLRRSGTIERPPPYAPEFVDAVRRHYGSGHTQTEVAAVLGTTQKVIWNLMRKHGIPRRPSVKRDGQRGAANNGWRAHSTNYATLHNRVESARGRPQRCEHCGTTEPRRYHWANVTGDYQDVDDFVRLCVPCHRRFDAERRRVTGQPTMTVPR